MLGMLGSTRKKSHILQLLHDYIVCSLPPPTTRPTSPTSPHLPDRPSPPLTTSPTPLTTSPTSSHRLPPPPTTLPPSSTSSHLQNLLSPPPTIPPTSSTFSHLADISVAVVCTICFCCELCYKCTVPCWEGIIELFSVLVQGIIFLILSPVVFIMFIIFAIQLYYVSPYKWEIREHSPTVEELKRLGVKFKKLDGEGIRHIEFKESNRTLYLPQFKVDNRSEVILRNLIAFEICCQEEQRPITRYAILMNDLINTSEDVGILRREDIINSKLGSDEEIARFWNSMPTSTEVPRYGPIEQAVSSIDNYRKKWWKVLWAQFVMIHCSKPWLFLSLLAGLSLLLLTTAQVVCLFASCQIK